MAKNQEFVKFKRNYFSFFADRFITYWLVLVKHIKLVFNHHYRLFVQV